MNAIPITYVRTIIALISKLFWVELIEWSFDLKYYNCFPLDLLGLLIYFSPMLRFDACRWSMELTNIWFHLKITFVKLFWTKEYLCFIFVLAINSLTLHPLLTHVQVVKVFECGVVVKEELGHYTLVLGMLLWEWHYILWHWAFVLGVLLWECHCMIWHWSIWTCLVVLIVVL